VLAGDYTLAQAPDLNSEPTRWSDSYVQAVVALPLPTIYDAPRNSYCSCVDFAKWSLGKQGRSWGIAKDVKADTDNPEYGDLLLTNESRYGHVAVIVGVTETEVTIIEGNYITCGKTKRVLKKDDPRIRGFRKASSLP